MVMLKLNAEPSTTPRPPRSYQFILPRKLCIGFARRDHLLSLQKTPIRGLIKNFTQHRQQNIANLS
jgi:hypothetical protein